MDLATLTFKVETGELVNAANAINALGTAVQKLNTPTEKAAASTEKLEQAQTKVTAEAKKSVSVLEKQQMVLEFMSQGYSRGQSSMLATAKAAGALGGEIEQLGKVLVTQRTLMGTDPFDKSIGAMQALKNEYTVTKEVQRLYNAELGLTKSQMESLAKDKLRLIEQYKIEGKSLSDIKAGLTDLNIAYIQNATAENNITNNIKNKQKAQADAAKAQDYIARETDRVNRLISENGTITNATNSKILAMEKALRQSGMAASEQTAALAKYKENLLSVQKAAGNRQIDYLSRALGPQITDIFTGLATGQSPMMVLLQQGGQLRDQFALAGVAGAKMGEMLVTASKSMVSSVKDVALAIGGLLVSAIKSVASTVVGGAFTLIVDGFKAIVLGGESATAAFERVKLAAIGLGNVGIAALITGAVLMAKGFYDATMQSDRLVTQLTLAGGSMGMNKDRAIDYARSLDQAGISTSKALSIISDMAKEGGFLASQIPLVTRAAVDMQTYASVAIDDTVKAFAKMRDEPVKALFDLAKATGMVSPEITKMVVELEKHGKASEATALAIKTLADVNNTQIERMKGDYSNFAIFMKESGAMIANWFDSIFKDLWHKANPKDAIKEQIAAIDDLLNNNAGLAGVMVGKFGVGEEGYKAKKAALQEQLALLEKASTKEQEQAANQSLLAKYQEEFYKSYDSFASNKEKREKAIAEATVRNEKLIAAGLITRAQAEQEIVNIKKKYKDEQRSLTFFESEIQNAQKLAAQFEEAQINLNEAQKKMLSLAVDPRFLELGMKEQQKIMVELVKASDTINQKSRFQYNLKQNNSLNEENEALRTNGELIGATEEAKIRFNAQLEAEKKLRAELVEIQKQSWSEGDKEAERAAAYERYNQRLANSDIQVSQMLKAERLNGYDTAFKNMFNGMGDALANFVLTGKMNMKDLVDTMIADLIRLEMRMQMMQLYNAMGGAKGLFSMMGGGWQSGTQASGATVGSSMSTGSTVVATPLGPLQADGGVWNNGIQMFAKGGSFTNSIVDSPTMFKFAKGTGLMGEAGPEAIMPLRRGADGSLGVVAGGNAGNNTQVTIINNSGAKAETKESTDSRGNRKIEVVIGDMAAAEVQRNGSASQKAMSSTYGIKPALIRR